LPNKERERVQRERGKTKIKKKKKKERPFSLSLGRKFLSGEKEGNVRRDNEGKRSGKEFRE